MTNMFTMDKRDVIKFTRFLTNAKRGLPRATGTFLNALGFEMRDQSINTLSERLFVKQPGFIPKRIQVEKNRNYAAVAGQQVEVGSTALPRFGGWLEQMGKSEGRERGATLHARRGNRARPIVRRARMLPGRELPKPTDYKGPSKHIRAMVLMRDMKRKKYRKPFVVFGHQSMKSGLYQLARNVPRMLQSFDPPKKTRGINWLDIALNRTTTPRVLKKVWAGVMTALYRRR